MGFHTFDAAEADRLSDPTRFRFCSREELLQHLPTGDATRLLDLGSGSGFYTDELAPHVGRVAALDVQRAMHGSYRDRGMPGNVDPITAEAGSLPFRDGTFDGIVSTMTFHESTTEGSIAEAARVLDEGGRFVAVDWSAAGNGEAGPPRDERFDAADAGDFLAGTGLNVTVAAERSETFVVVAEK